MEKSRENKGITLVALVITTIILLILAGISIQAISNTGLFANAKIAKEKSMEGQLKEEISLAIQDIEVEEISKGNGVTLETLAGGQLENKLKDITAELDDDKINGEYSGYEYTIDSKFNVKIENKVTGISLKFELNNDKEYTNEEIILTVKASSTEGDITGIQEAQASGLKKNEDGTYTITENGRYEFTATDSKGNTKTKEITVKKIDKLVPSKVEVKATGISLKSFSVQVIAEDAAADEKNSQSGIAKYEYYIKETESTGDYTKSESNSVEKEYTELEIGKKYSIYVRAYDKANNYKDSAITEVETLKTPAPAIAKITFNETNSTVKALDYPILTLNGIMNCEVIPNDGENVKIEMTSSAPSDSTYYYSLDGGITWNLYTEVVETQYVGDNKIKTKSVYNNDSSIESEIYTVKNYKKDLNYVCTATDAISSLTYDGKYDSYQTQEQRYRYIKVEPECWKKYLSIYANARSGRGHSVFYKNNKSTVIQMGWVSNLSGCSGDSLKTKSIKIPEDTYYIALGRGTQWEDEYYNIYEIFFSNESLNGKNF